MRLFKMPKLSGVYRFAAIAMAAIVVFTVVWTWVAEYVALPTAYVSGWLLESFAAGWVQYTEISHIHELVINTSLSINNEQTNWRVADIVLELEPSRYGYSLPVFLALVFALRAKDFLLKALFGFFLLMPFQVFSLVTQSLMQIALAANLDLQVLGVKAWQLEVIAYNFQLGALMVPVLSPFLLWLWLDWKTINRRFILQN